MIRGKYLRERKAIRFKRRIKLIIIMLIMIILHRIIFSSFSLYESEANSTNDLDVAFYVLSDTYQHKEIPLEDMMPGDENEYTFSIANYRVDENTNEKFVAETDIEYTLTIKTTTNLFFEYELYVDQDPTNPDSENISIANPTPFRDEEGVEDATYFKEIAKATYTFKQSAGENLDKYTLKIKMPESYDSVEYQNIIDCIEIIIESHQLIVNDTTGDIAG